MALSGGGFRAAAFHLGTLKALKELELLDDVRLLSTASGGSILGGLWVTSIVEKRQFVDFEKRVEALLERNIVAEALDRLHYGKRRPSLIQRVAEVYDGLYGGRRLGVLANDAELRKQFDHVVVNATHFSLGYGFRFTFPPRERAKFGNKGMKVSDADAWKDVRLADAVAASSCFPAAFEPLQFPEDFDWSGPAPTVTATGVTKSETETTVPLMDGGIYDNQAIDALLLIDSSTRDTQDPGDDLGLMFCSDVDQKLMPFFKPPHEGWGWKVARALPLWVVALILGVATGWLFNLAASTGGLWSAILGTVLATLVVALLGLLVLATRSLKAQFFYPKLPFVLLRATLGDLGLIVRTRLASVLSLATAVFMYRVRALGYSVAHWQMPNRVVCSQIYGIEAKEIELPKEVLERAELARRVATTLWMTREQREAVVGTGHATAICVLRRYLARWNQANVDGEHFRTDLPYPEALAERVERAWWALAGRDL